MDNQIKINWKAFLQKKLQEEQISPKAQIRIIETVENLFNHLLKSQRDSFEKEKNEYGLDQYAMGQSEGIEYGRLKERQSRDKELVEKIILDVVYACAEYTNMHQDTDPENIAVNTVRANILNRLSLLKEDIKN